MPRLLRSLRFRNERHFDRARADLLRCVHPEESVPSLLPLPGASASSSITWADSAPAVAAAKYDRPADRELVMAAALALDKKLAFLSLGPHSEAETRALLASTHGGGGGQPQPLLAVDATPHGAGLGVFAARDIEAGTVVTEYAGTTLVGADAAALRTAADEWGVVWEEAAEPHYGLLRVPLHSGDAPSGDPLRHQPRPHEHHYRPLHDTRPHQRPHKRSCP